MERITDSQTHVIEVLDAARLLDQRGVLAAAHAATDDQRASTSLALDSCSLTRPRIACDAQTGA